MKRRGTRSALFLGELLFCLLAFALCMTVCVRLLVRSHTMGRESRDLVEAVRLATNAAEEFRAAPAETQTTAQTGAFTVALNATKNDGLYAAHIVVSNTDGQVYTLDCAVAEVGP